MILVMTKSEPYSHSIVFVAHASPAMGCDDGHKLDSWNTVLSDHSAHAETRDTRRSSGCAKRCRVAPCTDGQGAADDGTRWF
jgi:hypothetical protein